MKTEKYSFEKLWITKMKKISGFSFFFTYIKKESSRAPSRIR